MVKAELSGIEVSGFMGLISIFRMCLVAGKVLILGKNWGKFSGVWLLGKYWFWGKLGEKLGVSGETTNFGFLRRFEELQGCGNSKKKKYKFRCKSNNEL